MKKHSVRVAALSVCLTALLSLSPAAMAQYTTGAEMAAKQKSESEASQMAFLNELVGKTLWVNPTPYHKHHMFYKNLTLSPQLKTTEEFFPTQPTSFEVLELITGKNWKGYDTHAYKVRFQDGMEGYIPAFSLGDSEVWRPYRLSNKLQDADSAYTDKFLTESPEAIRATAERLVSEEKEKERQEELQRSAEKAKRDKQLIAIEKEAKRRGGVRIGMSQKQVRASNWGAPNSINRTTTANGVNEQWVYGNSYLYFTNGRLTAIQN